MRRGIHWPTARIEAMPSTETFRRDVLWNLASIAVLGMSGFALNIIIGRYYSIETFGVFSQVLAVYYVLSQLAVGGFVFSSLYMVAEHATDPDKVAQIVPAALILTALQASVVCVSAYGLTDWIGKFFDSPVVARGLLWTLPGLWCFAINKVLLSSINGLSHMRFYALINSLRFLLILTTLLVLTAFSVDETMLPMCLSAGEIILLPILAIYLFRLHPVLLTRDMIPWMRRHMHFGGQAFFSGLLMDINLKVDVVLLGYFFSDQVVGIYSFAAMLAIEGISQIVVAIQININPILTRLKLEGRMQESTTACAPDRIDSLPIPGVGSRCRGATLSLSDSLVATERCLHCRTDLLCCADGRHCHCF